MAGASTILPFGRDAPSFAYPLGKRGKIIGRPGQGTHSYQSTPNNWQSDNAIDIGVPVGTPVIAVEDGTISPHGLGFGDGGAGRFAGLKLHLESSSNTYFYTHLSRYAAGIKPGTKVKKGQVIGYSGSANGVAHLHFGELKGDPLNLITGKSTQLSDVADPVELAKTAAAAAAAGAGAPGAVLDAAAEAARKGAQAALQAIWDQVGTDAGKGLLWASLVGGGSALAVYGLVKALGAEQQVGAALSVAKVAATRGAIK